jgi:hypothetical protein
MLVARLSLETGLSPQTLLDLDTRMFRALLQAMKDRAKEQEHAYKGRARR